MQFSELARRLRYRCKSELTTNPAYFLILSNAISSLNPINVTLISHLRAAHYLLLTIPIVNVFLTRLLTRSP